MTKGRTVFITLEDSERTLADRMRAWLQSVPAGQERENAERDLRANFAYLAREQARDLALTFTNRATTERHEPVVRHLSALVKGAVLVVLETASRLHGGPELNEALAVFAQAIERIAIDSGAAVVVVRHVSKEAAREQTIDSYVGRGGGALSDAARSILVMTPNVKRRKGEENAYDPSAPVKLTHAKANLSARGPTIVWQPVETKDGVYLRVLSGVEETTTNAQRLLAYLRGCPDGVTPTDLHKKKPAGLGRDAAMAAVEFLLASGSVAQSQEQRGRTKQAATVYRAVATRERP